MGTGEYMKKRDLKKSPEPKMKKKKTGRSIFVIQKHDASHLHYDFRLEIDGVLKSWAIPKGPSTDPKDKRLAILTEDHPIDYADFEGVIPEGNYGAGKVIVWDKGTFSNKKDKTLSEQFDDGVLEVEIKGKKIEGGYALRRFRGEKNWLLIKMKDDKADARRNPVSSEPESVISGKKIEELEKPGL